MGDETSIDILVGKPATGSEHSGDITTDGRIILKQEMEFEGLDSSC
jgi:hypothetical protein